jgi:hypothetical protein
MLWSRCWSRISLWTEQGKKGVEHGCHSLDSSGLTRDYFSSGCPASAPVMLSTAMICIIGGDDGRAATVGNVS